MFGINSFIIMVVRMDFTSMMIIRINFIIVIKVIKIYFVMDWFNKVFTNMDLIDIHYLNWKIY